MPSPRKRIGFLPSEEVHEIIEKLCTANEFSQSKVTGLLVEEALRSRGVLNQSFAQNKTDKGDLLSFSFDQEASLAQGINVGRVIALVWFMAAMLASLSGFFITGGFNGLTQASFVTALRALPAIVIGGIDSLVGAVVGSLIIGMTQGYIAYYQLSIEASLGFSFGTGFSALAPYIIMFFILIIR